jgi:hypothetical protein
MPAGNSSYASEDGGVLVMVALWLPIIILFITLVVDVGNWFEHKRHLQVQADASALAAAGDFRIPCTDQPIVDRANQYAGFSSPSGTTYNPQVAGGQTRTHIMMNSVTYYNQSSPTDSTVRTGAPCAAGMIDVKLTETDLPWYFGFGKVVSFINAHARVEIKPLFTTAGALPVGVPDVNPQSGSVSLINEANGNVLSTCSGAPCTAPLVSNGSINGYVEWDNGASPFAGFSIPAGVTNVGVRVNLGGGSGTTCGQPLVSCYDLSSASTGLNFIRGYPTSGSGAQPAAPIARGVTLFTNSCADAYFSSSSSSCTIGVRAKVDFGGLVSPGAAVRATINGTTNTLVYNSVTQVWESSSSNNSFFTLPASPASGRLPVTLDWAETVNSVTGLGNCSLPNQGPFGNANKCQGSFGTVQGAYVASDATSGPIKIVQTTENGATGANSFAQGTTHDLVIKIGVLGSLSYASSVGDPIVTLRVVGGSQNQSLDCDPNVSRLADEIAKGCQPQYTKNSGTACPTGASALWASAQPWSCVALQTGTAVNQVPEGMNMRILGAPKPNICTNPSHWSQFPNLPAGDPRIVPVFLTPFGSFDGSGSATTVPVENFAFFYVTGWTGQGQGFNNPCSVPPDDPSPGPGYIVGHFIKYVQTINTGGGGPGFCDLSTGSLNTGACVAVLTQ